MESLKPVRKRQEHKEGWPAGHATRQEELLPPERDGAILKLDKEGKVIKKHKTKHKHKSKEKVVLCQPGTEAEELYLRVRGLEAEGGQGHPPGRRAR